MPDYVSKAGGVGLAYVLTVEDLDSGWFSSSVGGATDTGSLLVTASFLNPYVTFSKGDGTEFYINLVTLVPTNASTASFVTASNVYGPYGANSVISASVAATASFALTASSLQPGIFVASPPEFGIQFNSQSSFAATESLKFNYFSQGLEHGNGVVAGGFYSHAHGLGSQTIISGAFSASVVNGLITISSSYGDKTSEFFGGNLLFLYDVFPLSGVYGRQTFTIAGVTYNGVNTKIQLNDASVNTQNAYVGSLDISLSGWGGDQIIKGDYSTAQGGATIAIGTNSHTEGFASRAVGVAAHAEGVGTLASGEFAHAEGFATLADGDSSHAEGYATIAKGVYSHAEGMLTTASVSGSHAEGVGTLASGNPIIFTSSSNVFQSSSLVDDANIFIVPDTFYNNDNKNIVYTPNSEWLTYFNNGYNNDYSTYFMYVSASGPSGQEIYKIDTVYDDGAGSYYLIPEFSYPGLTNTDHTVIRGSTDNPLSTTGQLLSQGIRTTVVHTVDRFAGGSHAEGSGSQALANFSHAEGELTTTRGIAAHAEGFNTKAGIAYAANAISASLPDNYNLHLTFYGQFPTLISGSRPGNVLVEVDGEFDNPSNRFDYLSTVATILTSNFDGVNTHATLSGDFSTVNWSSVGVKAKSVRLLPLPPIGNDPNAFFGPGVDSIWGADYEAYGTVEIGQAAHAEGTQTEAFAPGSHAEGRSSMAYGPFSHAEGFATKAENNFSHAEGYESKGSGKASHAEGYRTIAVGSYSHAEGQFTKAIGTGSHAEGIDTEAVGDNSHAEGDANFALGPSSHAEGLGTYAIGEASHAEGRNTVASGAYQHVQGQYNLSSSAESAFIIGNGTADNARSNLVFASGSLVQITGSLAVTVGITGSLFGTSSWALQALTASFVTASNVYGPFNANSILSASHGVTASFIDGGTF